MNIVKNFGLDPVMMLAQIVNFLIVFYILKRFLYKPVLDILNKRRETIQLGLKEAEEGKKLLVEASLKEKNILKNANTEAQKIIESAKQEALGISKKANLDVKKEVDSMFFDAREKIKQETREAEKKLAIKVSQLAVDFLNKSLRELFGPAQQKELLEITLKKLNKPN